TAGTTDAELLEIFKSILRQLQDHHVTLSSNAFRFNAGGTPLFDQAFADYLRESGGKVSLNEFIFGRSKELLRPSWQHYLDPGSLQEISSKITIGKANGGKIGYFMILAESGYSGGTDLPAEQAAAEREFKRAFAQLKGVESLIVDVRVNYGGDDGIALLLA